MPLRRLSLRFAPTPRRCIAARQRHLPSGLLRLERSLIRLLTEILLPETSIRSPLEISTPAMSICGLFGGTWPT